MQNLMLILFVYYLILRFLIFDGLPTSAQLLVKNLNIESLRYFIAENEEIILFLLLYLISPVVISLVKLIFLKILEFLKTLIQKFQK